MYLPYVELTCFERTEPTVVRAKTFLSQLMLFSYG